MFPSARISRGWVLLSLSVTDLAPWSSWGRCPLFSNASFFLLCKDQIFLQCSSCIHTLHWLSQVHVRPEAFSRLLLLSLTFANYWPLLFPSIMPALKIGIWQFMSYAPILCCIPKREIFIWYVIGGSLFGRWSQKAPLGEEDSEMICGRGGSPKEGELLTGLFYVQMDITSQDLWSAR